MLTDYRAMSNSEYHEKQLTYNMTALLAQINKEFPNDKNPDLNDPKYSHIVKSSPFIPSIMGNLAKSFGIDNSVLTVSLWRDISNGYIPAKLLPPDSPLLSKAIDTPRGKMLQLNKNATKIAASGAYKKEKKKNQKKNKRTSTEFLFTQGKNTSIAVQVMEAEQPGFEKRYVDLIQSVFKKHICPEILQDAIVREGTNGVDKSWAEELVFINFYHNENRLTEPFSHFHFNLISTALSSNEKLLSVCTDLIGQNKDKYNAIFQAKVKEALAREFGWTFKPVYSKEDAANPDIAPEDKVIVSYDLEDKYLPQGLVDHFSQRSAEIEKELEKQKQKGKEAKELARLETREQKTDLSPQELRDLWKEDFAKFNVSAQTIISNCKQPQTDQREPTVDGDKLIANFLRKHKEINFSESQFKAHIVKQLLLTHSYSSSQKIAAELFEKQCQPMLGKEHATFFDAYLKDEIADPKEYLSKQISYLHNVSFVTNRSLEQDKYIVSSLKAREGEASFVINKEVWKTDLETFQKGAGFNFAKGQLEAIDMVLTEKGAVSNISGRAGAGKSTLLKFCKEALEDNGFKVIGTSTSSAATEELAKSTGMKNAVNTAKLLALLKHGKMKLDRQTVVFVDEAGMMDLESFYGLIKCANEAGAKLVLTGEREQLQPVAHGGTFNYLTEQFATTQVREINRQKSAVHRDMVEDFASGRSAKAMETLYSEGRVKIAKTDQDRIHAVVKDYLASTETYQQKAIIAPLNTDTDLINNLIRAELQKKGEISTEEVKVKCKDGIDRNFAQGDRVIFTKNCKSDDVERQEISNSQCGKIKAIRYNLAKKPTAFVIEMDNGKLVQCKISNLHLKHSHARTVHKSQGQTVNSAFYFPSASLNSLHQAYVACSRHRSEIKVYLSDEMADKIENKMEDLAPTEKMKGLCTDLSKSKGIAPPDFTSFQDCREFLDKHWQDYSQKSLSPLSKFSNILTAMSKTQFKKTTFDFDVASKDVYVRAKQQQKQRIQSRT